MMKTARWMALITVLGMPALGFAQPPIEIKGLTDAPKPSDKYIEILAGKQLVEGKGFPGLFELGDPISKATEVLGTPGRHESNPFWHVYEEGDWALTICTASYSDLPLERHIHAIIVRGDDGPATAQGLKPGSEKARAQEVYSELGAYKSGIIGDYDLGVEIPHITFENGRLRFESFVINEPEQFKGGLYDEKTRTLITLAHGYVNEIAVIAPRKPLPPFLWPKEEQRKNQWVSMDIVATKPIESVTEGNPRFRVPMPPKLKRYVGDGYTISRPKDWVGAGGIFRADKDHPEVLAIQASAKTDDEIGEALGKALSALLWKLELKAKLGDDRVPPSMRALPPSFCDLIQAEEAQAFESTLQDAGTSGGHLGVYAVMARKGDRQWLAIVTRSWHPQTSKDNRMTTAFMGSPDGLALASEVFRSWRLKK